MKSSNKVNLTNSLKISISSSPSGSINNPTFLGAALYSKRLNALAGYQSSHYGYSLTKPNSLSNKGPLLRVLATRRSKLKLQLSKRLSTFHSFLIKSGSYKGWRLKKGLPMRGQRTHTNASTARKLNYPT